jgi:hypothetical protein
MSFSQQVNEWRKSVGNIASAQCLFESTNRIYDLVLDALYERHLTDSSPNPSTPARTVFTGAVAMPPPSIATLLSRPTILVKQDSSPPSSDKNFKSKKLILKKTTKSSLE